MTISVQDSFNDSFSLYLHPSISFPTMHKTGNKIKYCRNDLLRFFKKYIIVSGVFPLGKVTLKNDNHHYIRTLESLLEEGQARNEISHILASPVCSSAYHRYRAD